MRQGSRRLEVKSMDIEIVAVGSELCYGKVADTNSFWLADKVTRLGGTVTRITCVRDYEDQICRVLEESFGRKPSFVLVTGGLGPTKDDKTIDAISKLTHSSIVTNQLTLEKVSERKGIPREKLPQHLIRMARTLSGGTAVTNPLGVSPCTVLRIRETTLVMMPGPPKEVQAIFEASISDLIRKDGDRRACSQRVFVDMFESEVTPLIEEIESKLSTVYLKPLVSAYVPATGLPIEILAFGVNEQTCSLLLKEAIRHLEKAVKTRGRHMFLSPQDNLKNQ
jgi:nicotinamide-nucleotide amidase